MAGPAVSTHGTAHHRPPQPTRTPMEALHLEDNEVGSDFDDDAFLLAAEAEVLGCNNVPPPRKGGGSGTATAASTAASATSAAVAADSPTSWSTRGRPLDPWQESRGSYGSPAARPLGRSDGNMYVSPVKWSASQAAAGKENQCDARYPQFDRDSGSR